MFALLCRMRRAATAQSEHRSARAFRWRGGRQHEGRHVRAGQVDDAESRRRELQQCLAAAKWPLPDWPVKVPTADITDDRYKVSGEETDRRLRICKRVRFVQATDGASLAWATVIDRSAPPLVRAANWLSHLELNWEARNWNPLFRDLAQHRRLICYDERGCGLSEWEVEP
jgi:hypothetical protein